MPAAIALIVLLLLASPASADWYAAPHVQIISSDYLGPVRRGFGVRGGSAAEWLAAEVDLSGFRSQGASDNRKVSLNTGRLLVKPWPAAGGLRASMGVTWFATYTDELDTARRIRHHPGLEAGAAYLKDLGPAVSVRIDVRHFRTVTGPSFPDPARSIDGWVTAVGLQFWLGRRHHGGNTRFPSWH